MLACLDGVLLGGKSVGVVAHGMKHVETLLALVAGVDVAGDVSERMPHVKSRSGRVGEHVEHIEFLARRVLRHFVYFVVTPVFLPASFDFFMIVFHCECCF